VASLGSIGTAVYHSQVVVPAEVSAAAADTAREGIAGAVVAAQHLPAGIGAELLQSAAAAFTVSLRLSCHY
jgi:MFS transporter, DHA2 family, multidrug resistance protein